MPGPILAAESLPHRTYMFIRGVGERNKYTQKIEENYPRVPSAMQVVKEA